MSLGTGIFLSALFLGILYFYKITRERWNWKRGLKRLVIGTIALCILLAGGTELYDRYQYRFTKPVEYYDIALGIDMRELKYIKGEPDSVRFSDNPEKEPRTVSLKSLGTKKIEAANDWTYNESGGSLINVGFDDQRKVDRVICVKEDYCNSLLGVGTYTDEKRVIETLGRPSKEGFYKSVKHLYYDDQGVLIVLQKQMVKAIGIATPKRLKHMQDAVED